MAGENSITGVTEFDWEVWKFRDGILLMGQPKLVINSQQRLVIPRASPF